MNNAAEKLDALMSDNAFVTALVKNLDNTDALTALFTENGIDVSAEEIAEFAAAIKQKLNAEENGELDEEAMDSVSGGKFITVFGGFFLSKWWQSVKEVNSILNPKKGSL